MSTLLADGLISCEGKYGQRLYSLTSYGMRFAPDTIPGMKQGKSKLIQRTDTNVICRVPQQRGDEASIDGLGRVGGMSNKYEDLIKTPG